MELVEQNLTACGARAPPSPAETASTCPSLQVECARSSSRRTRRRNRPCSPPNGPCRQTRSVALKQIAHDDPIGVPFADRDLVNADHLRSRRAGALELGFHVLLVERLDRMPVQLQFRCHILDRRRPAATADITGKALGVERIVGQEVEPLALHLATTAAVEAPHLQLQKNPRVAARQIAHAPNLAIVPAGLDPTAAAACRFFDRRWSRITRAFGSPNTPCTVGSGRTAGTTHPQWPRSLRLHFIPFKCQIATLAEIQNR